MNLNNRILVFSYDAGGANLAMAYAYYKNKEGYEVKCFPKGPALKIFENHIPSLISKEMIDLKKSDIIVTGTSGMHSDYEMEIIKKFKNRVYRTITLLDASGNLKMRFSIDGIALNKEFLPDEIYYEENFDFLEHPLLKLRVIKKENLYLKYLKEVFYKSKVATTNKDILKYKKNYLLVLTEYISDLYGDKFGFNEFDFLKDILTTIDNLSLNIVVFIKSHPAEDLNKYDAIISKYKNIKIYKANYNIQEVLFNSKIVFGLNSSVFKEALVLEKPIYSVQIGAKKNLDTIKEVEVVTSSSELKNILNKYYKDKK